MEYYYFFGLKGEPFRPASPDGAVYFSPTHLEGLNTLEAGLSGNGNGLSLLTGEAGTGKTTLIYSLLQRDFKRVRIAHIDDPKLSFLEIMRIILTQMSLYSAGSTKLDYLKAIDHLLELRGSEERIAIVVDEAQVLNDDVMEELGLLWNRGQSGDRYLLQVILVGQPELVERLKKPNLRQLNQRVSSRGVLNPLNIEQGIMYVDCRLNAQGSNCATVFDPRALKHLLRRSDGIPRKINMLCRNAMREAFYAGERKVNSRIARKVAAEYQESVSITGRRSAAQRLLMPALVAGTALASLVLLGLVYPRFLPDWVHNHIAASREVAEAPLDPIEIVERAQAARHLKKDSATIPEEATFSTPDPVELRRLIAHGAAGPLALKVDVTGPATAPEMRRVLSAPAAATVTAGIQKPTGVTAAPAAKSISVRSGAEDSVE